MTTSTLSENIQAFQDKLLPTIDKVTLDLMMSELGSLVSAGIAEQALTTGASFPDFTLPDAQGRSVSLQNLLINGPLVINFYRGAWCPYCNLELNALQQRRADIENAGGRLIAVSPQTPDKSLDQVSQSKLDFDVLSDVGNTLARQCGLVFTLPEPLRPIYADWEIDIPDHNNDDSFELPIPATYILDTNGVIQFAYINMDYTQRLEPEMIVEQLSKL